MGIIHKIELQLLQIAIPAGSEGRNFGLNTLLPELARTNKELQKMAMNEADECIIGALLDLLERKCIRIRHYIDGDSIARQGSAATVQFYRGTFTFTREFPAAFTRRDELTGKSKYGIFISHNVPEAELAIAIKDFLRSALGKDYPVFVSSDFTTIQTGKPWFTEIVTAVRTAIAVIVIVTPDSINQRWLNFEAGIGIGSGVPVMPLLARGLTKNDFKPPLNQLQARDLANKADFDGMIGDFKEIFGCTWREDAKEALFVDLQRICRALDGALKT
jgi:hypothetical protein